MATRQFLMHVKYTISYRIVSHRFSVFFCRPPKSSSPGTSYNSSGQCSIVNSDEKKLLIDNEIIRIMLFSDTRRGEV